MTQTDKRPLRWAFLGLLLFLLLLAGRGRNSFVLLHDNFDSEVVWVVLLTRLRLALAGGPGVLVLPIMNGLPRDAMRSGLSVTFLVFGALRDSPLAAYLLHEALARLAGLLGMYALLRRYGLTQPVQRGLAASVALLWAVLPAYSIFGLSVLGQPWLLLAAWRLRDDHVRRRWLAYLVCLAFPLWSALVLVGVFAGAVWAAGLLFDLVRRGRAAWPATWRGLAGLALLGGGYAVVEWRMLNSLLVVHEFVAHREAFDLARLEPGGWGRWMKQAGQLFWLGQYHASAFFKGGIALAVGIVLARLAGAARRALARQTGLALAGILVLCAGAAALPLLSARLQGALPLLHAFSLERFYFLLALAWVLVLVLALRQLPAGGRLAYALVALQLPLALAANPEVVNNLRALLGRPVPNAPGYAAYTAPGLWAQARQAIARQGGGAPASYRVVCLGLPPAAAQLNGFYTLDSYQTLYPLSYKHAFRRIMAGELAKDPTLATYFDAWGNRCYLFSAELGRDYFVGKAPARTVQHLAFDAVAFRALGGRYVLSAVALAHPADSHLRLLGVFDDSQAYWRLHVYEVAP